MSLRHEPREQTNENRRNARCPARKASRAFQSRVSLSGKRRLAAVLKRLLHGVILRSLA